MSPSKRASEPNEFGGEWSIRKLRCVEKYLASYLHVFKHLDWADLWYIDAFSGDGIQRIKQSGKGVAPLQLFPEYDSQITEFAAGSSLRALQISMQSESKGGKGFHHFAFIELNPDKLRSLEDTVRQRFPNQLHKCAFIEGDVNTKLPELLSRIEWKEGGRAVTFIDPYATQLHWPALQSFKGTCADVWLLFPLQGILRMMPRDRPPDRKLAESLDAIFGDTSWSELYHEPKAVQPDLFGEVEGRLERDSGAAELLGYYRRRLQTVFPGVLEPAELRTSNNAPLFALFSLVANESARALDASQRIAKHLLESMSSEAA